MPFAVALLLDARAARAVEGVWDRLAAARLGVRMRETAVRPHVTLAVYEDLDLEPFRVQVEAFFAAETPADVALSGVGTFQANPGVLFLAPVVTPELLDLHERFHRRFDHLADGAWAYYRPGSWVPHCTLAEGLAEGERAPALDEALSAPLPAQARLGTAWVAAFDAGTGSPARTCFETAFGV